MPKLPAISQIPQEIKNKYSIVNNALIRSEIKNAELDKYKNEPKDEVKITLGDKDKSEFTPEVELKRWNEVGFKIKPKGLDGVATKDKKLSFNGDKVKYDTPKISFEMYNYTEGEGGFKYIWYLNEKPLTNKIEFDIETSGLNFYHQPPMTEEHLEEGQTADETHIYDSEGNIVAERPIEVVNSYAVYHSTKGGMNDAYGKDYKTGQAFMIYRPHLIDANGLEAWGNLHIENGIYSVEIPQDFLDKVVYPIKSNDTIGTVSIGSSDAANANLIFGSLTEQAGNSGTMSKIQICAYAPGADGKMGVALYNSVSSTPTSLVANSYPGELSITRTTKPTQDSEWTASTNVSGSIVLNNYYFVSYDNKVNTAYVAYNSTTGVGKYASLDYASFPTSTFPAQTNLTRTISIYATYTPSGGGAARVPRQGFANLATSPALV